jgi:hypothetical protein
MFIHSAGTAATAASFQGNLPEYLGYLGWPLLLALVALASVFWGRVAIRALAVTWVVTELFSLGGTLLTSGHGHPAVKLPWYWLQGLPVISSVLPDRFSLLADGAAAALLAFAIDAAVPVVATLAAGRASGSQAAGRAASMLAAVARRPLVAVMSCAVLVALPVAPRPLPVSAPTPLPPGWSAVFADLRLPSSATVLVVPIPLSTFTEPLRWQADSGEPGALVGGYFMGPAWDGHVYIDGNGTPPAGLFLNQLWRASAPALPAALTGEAPQNSAPTATGNFVPAKPVSAAQMRAQLATWRAAAVVAVTTPGSALAQYLTVLLGRPAAASGDVIAWRA